MEVLFLQDWFNPATNKMIIKGRRVHIMKAKAIELIKKGIVEEVLAYGEEKGEYSKEETDTIHYSEDKLTKKKRRKKLF